MDKAVSSDESVAIDDVLLHAEITAAMAHQLVQFFKRALIEQKIDAFPCGKLSFAMLALFSFSPAPGLRARVAFANLFQTTLSHRDGCPFKYRIYTSEELLPYRRWQ